MFLENKWQFVTTISLAQPTKKVLPIALSHRFTSRIIRTETAIRNVPIKWRRAAYLKQVISLVPADETKSVIIPLNTRKIFPLPLLASSYQLIITPVDWLPAGLRIRFWEYKGDIDQAFINELLLAQSS